MVPGGSRITFMVYSITCFRGLDLYCTDPAQYLITAGYDLDDLDDLSDLSDLSDLPDLSDLSDTSDISDLSDISEVIGRGCRARFRRQVRKAERASENEIGCC